MRDARNGYDLWKQLHLEYEPRTGNRKLALVSSVMKGDQLVKAAANNFEEKLMNWEEEVSEYGKIADHPFDDSLKMAIVLEKSPKEVKTHLQVNMKDINTYNQMRDIIEAYLKAKQLWRGHGGNDPMDIGALGKKGKGKGCFNCGGPHLARDCPHPKGQGKSKDKSKDKGKDKGGKDKGGKAGGGKDGKAQDGRIEGYCGCCGKWGHTSRECWKPKEQKDTKGTKGDSKGKDAKGKMKEKGGKGVAALEDQESLIAGAEKKKPILDSGAVGNVCPVKNDEYNRPDPKTRKSLRTVTGQVKKSTASAR